MQLLQVINEENIGAAYELFGKQSQKFFTRLAIDLIAVFILIRLIYYRIYKNREFFFPFFIFNLIIFMITFLLNKVEMSMGAAFGLFAVFSMLRYRTEGISMKDMTYLFLAIAIGLISAVNNGDAAELILENFIIVAVTYLLESNILVKKEASKVILYEHIEMIKPERKEDLIKDLENRTGLKINRISVHEVDFLKDAATIRVYYYE